MNARALHLQALEARENGDPLKSLLLDTEALVLYQQEDDTLGFTEVLADRSITLRHLADTTNDQKYLLVGRAELEAAVEIARESGLKDAIAIPLFQLARTLEELKQFVKATSTYQEALDAMTNHPPKSHSQRPALIADIKVHLYTCSVKAGNDEDLDKAIAALKELEDSQEEDSFTKNTWASGGHMRLAVLLKDSDPEQSKKQLQLAKEIIDNDTRLVVRSSQWEKLKTTFDETT